MVYILLASNFLMLAFFLLCLNHLPPQIPLFYSLPWGERQLTDVWMILLLPFSLDILFVANNMIYRRFFVGNVLVRKIINVLNIFLAIGITLIFVKIILLTT